MSEDIRISAKIAATRPQTCVYTVDRPLLEGRSAYFWDAARAASSPLARRLFAVEGVGAVRIEGNDVVVTRTGAGDWRAFSALAAAAIREQIKSGEPAVPAGVAADLKGELALKNKVQMIFDSQINPAVAAHGGHVELVDVKDHRIYLRMGGGCHGCSSANATLTQGIETTVRGRLPEIDEIVDVTNHAAGANPYYRASGE